jgi:hypothetical protein
MAAARKTSNDALLLALACGGTVENAARKVGLTERRTAASVVCPNALPLNSSWAIPALSRKMRAF